MTYTWSDSSNRSGYRCGCDSHSSYNYTESGLNMTASSLIASTTLVQPPLSPMVTA